MATGFAGLGMAVMIESGCELANALRMLSSASAAVFASLIVKVCTMPVIGSTAVTRYGILGGDVTSQR